MARKQRTIGRSGYRKWIGEMRLLPCHYCGEPGGTIDHIVPRSKGGTNQKENCVPACKACNEFRGDGDYEEFKASGWKARRFR